MLFFLKKTEALSEAERKRAKEDFEREKHRTEEVIQVAKVLIAFF